MKYMYTRMASTPPRIFISGMKAARARHYHHVIAYYRHSSFLLHFLIIITITIFFLSLH